MNLNSWLKERFGTGESTPRHTGKLAALSLASLGVVYGDIGTSPLYAVRACFFSKFGVEPTQPNVLGVLSLITWSLLLVISVKYLVFILRADNDGEGGILALMELVRRETRGRMRRVILILGLFGAALLYGDGMITPAISVLSAVEGLEVATPLFHPYVIPITIVVLCGLFLLQRLGTGGVGKLFGPVMVVWFSLLALTGVAAILGHPGVLAALNPYQGLVFLLRNGTEGIIILGIVFLVVTGGEALYADIGHFGKLPIRVGWYAFVLPSLLLNYLGQGALILSRPGITNPFYQMVPHWALYPLVGLATLATVIASQAIISGAFSLTFQAFHLGYLPWLEVRHTSPEQRGQIYIPLVNWILLAAAVGLVLGFRASGNLASAYGAAITTTMVITTLLFYVAARRIFHWSLPAALGLMGGFLVIDLAFFVANMRKFTEGGWFPLLVAAIVYLVMDTWQRGFAIEHRKSRNRIQTVREFLAEVGGGGKYRRVPGQAVYLTRNARGTPFVLRHNLEHNRSLHNLVVLYTARFLKAPRVRPAEHLVISRLRPDIVRVVARYGYMESVDAPRDLEEANRVSKLGLDLGKVSYFVGEGIPLPRRDVGLPVWRSWIYAMISRNKMRGASQFNLPPSQVLEIGAQVPV